jgi:hypothetical protein
MHRRFRCVVMESPHVVALRADTGRFSCQFLLLGIGVLPPKKLPRLTHELSGSWPRLIHENATVPEIEAAEKLPSSSQIQGQSLKP